MIARTTLMEWWPLVDVARLPLKPGDRLVLRTLREVDPETLARLGARFADAFGDHEIAVLNGNDCELLVIRSERAMRAEDLEQPRRKTTME